MTGLISMIGLVVFGVWLEKRYSPRLKKEQSDVMFHYTAAKGVRNKKKLF